MQYYRALTPVTLLLSLTACSGLSQIQDSVGKFDQSAHEVSVAELDFFGDVRKADCNDQNYFAVSQALYFASPVPLSPKCQPGIISDKQMEMRRKLMQAITLYVDKMQALASDDSDKKLTDNAEKLAGELNGYASSHGFSQLSTAKAVESAVTELSAMVLDQRRYRDLKDAAMKLDPYLHDVVTALKIENTADLAGLAGNAQGIEMSLRSIILTEQKKRALAPLSDVLAAQRIVRETQAMVYKDEASRLNAALDALTEANHAIASAGTGGVMAAVNDLVARARAARALQSGLNQ